MQPSLGSGWTLNYEMSFYLLFALCLFLPRKYGISAIRVVQLVLTRIGAIFHLGETSGQSPRAFYASPTILLFTWGVVTGPAEVSPIASLASVFLFRRPEFWLPTCALPDRTCRWRTTRAEVRR
jgi:peptidoglycan/LPS O-acetylase OafA/YrhL